jgi:hypothetical protein
MKTRYLLTITILNIYASSLTKKNNTQFQPQRSLTSISENLNYRNNHVKRTKLEAIIINPDMQHQELNRKNSQEILNKSEEQSCDNSINLDANGHSSILHKNSDHIANDILTKFTNIGLLPPLHHVVKPAFINLHSNENGKEEHKKSIHTQHIEDMLTQITSSKITILDIDELKNLEITQDFINCFLKHQDIQEYFFHNQDIRISVSKLLRTKKYLIDFLERQMHLNPNNPFQVKPHEVLGINRSNNEQFLILKQDYIFRCMLIMEKLSGIVFEYFEE